MTGAKQEQEIKEAQKRAEIEFRKKHGIPDAEWDLAAAMNDDFRQALFDNFWELWSRDWQQNGSTGVRVAGGTLNTSAKSKTQEQNVPSAARLTRSYSRNGRRRKNVSSKDKQAESVSGKVRIREAVDKEQGQKST